MKQVVKWVESGQDMRPTLLEQIDRMEKEKLYAILYASVGITAILSTAAVLISLIWH